MQRILVIVLLGIWLLSLPTGQQVLAQEPPSEEKEGVVFNLEGVKLGTILEYISRREAKPLLLDPTFPREEPVNMISPPGVSVPPDKLLDVIESILRMRGYAIVRAGPILKVVKSIDAKTHPTTVSGVADLEKIEGTDRVVTQIIPLEHADARTLVTLLNSLKSKEATLLVSTETNTVILTEYASNIRRLYEVIKQIDQAPAPYKTEVKYLKHTSATVLRPRIQEYIQAMSQALQPGTRGRTQPRPFVTIDERTNAIIIFALEDQLEQIGHLIEVLDGEVVEQVSKCYTYKLTNTKAEEVAKIVQSIFTKQLQSMIPSGRKPEEIVSITSEKTRNSLVIIAPPEVYGKMEELIKLIDMRKQQVLLEVAIVELSTEKMIELGIELAAVKGPTEKGRGFGGTSFDDMSSLKDPKDLTQGKQPLLSEGLTVGIWKETIGNIPFLLKAAQTDTGIDVLAVPRLLANDNAEASIDIGDSIPYDKTTYGPDGTITGISFGGYLDAGIKLKITPHIGEKDYLRLEIEQSEEQFFKTAYSTTMPAKTKRTTKTTVTVPDKETVILGGLTRDNITKTVKKIPLLGDIPLLGYLFRWTKDEVKKSNLCIFITPHIMRQSADLIEKTEESKEALERLRKSQPTPPAEQSEAPQKEIKEDKKEK